MRSYYFDSVEGDQRLPHDSGIALTPEQLASLGVKYWRIPVVDGWEAKIDEVAKERDYKNRDVINVSKAGLGDIYEEKLRNFFAEHLHEDEEIRYILDGTGFFDVREHPADKWVRIFIEPGDLLVIPAGIYHRFTLDEANYVKALRLFKDAPKWTPLNRGQDTDVNPHRKAYLESLRGISASA